MMHKITLFSGKTYEVTVSELNTILSADSLVQVPRLGEGVYINKRGISDIAPVGGVMQAKDLLQDRKKNREGILHDGTRAIRNFGQWYDPKGDYTDTGNPITRFSYERYPEIARDCVPSPGEYHEKYAHIIDRKERLKAILGDVRYSEGGKYLPQGEQGFKSIKDLTQKRIK